MIVICRLYNFDELLQDPRPNNQARVQGPLHRLGTLRQEGLADWTGLHWPDLQLQGHQEIKDSPSLLKADV